MTTKDNKSFCLTAGYDAARPNRSRNRKEKTMIPVDNINNLPDGTKYVYDENDKSHKIVKGVTEKSHPIKANYYKSSRANFENDTSKGMKFSATGVQQEDLTWRKLTPLECERLQTVPDNYTNHVSNTQRYKMLGNGWTVEVIKHILKGIK